MLSSVGGLLRFGSGFLSVGPLQGLLFRLGGCFELFLLGAPNRVEGALGIGLCGGVEETTTLRPDPDFEKRRQEEEAERNALEQLGTGGSAQSMASAIVERDEEVE